MGALSFWKTTLLLKALVIFFIGTECKAEVLPITMTGKSTWQSSDYMVDGEPLTSDLAIDGSSDTDSFNFVCSHTNTAPGWWAVDLGRVYKVASVTITNRGDCCSDRLKNFYIYGSLTSHVPSEDNEKSTCLNREAALGNGTTETLPCDQVINARYIIVTKEQEYLSLCEVVVNAEVEVVPLIMTGKHTWQSSDYMLDGKPLSSDLAIDGSSDVNSNNFVCSQTDISPGWWAVDLGKVYEVASVTITNRGDCCSDLLTDFYIYGALTSKDLLEPNVRSTCLKRETALGSGATETLPCDQVIYARFLFIRKETGYLNLCEVVVNVKAEIVPLNMTGKHTWQSSDYMLDGKPLSSDLAIDGSSDVDSNNFVCSQTDISPGWWAVDLGKVYKVASVTITNRGDCCSDLLKDFYIYGALTSKDLLEPNVRLTCLKRETALGSGATETLPCDQVIDVRFLFIRKETDYLNLCEVVFNVKGLPSSVA